MNANDTLSHYTGTDYYYKFHNGLMLTDGAKALADAFQCYWFLDIIASYYQILRKEEFQVWTLERKVNESSAVVLCTDGNNKTLIKQDIEYTDFKAESAMVWVEFNVILLPSEH